jgi:hypothetical protein
MKLCHLTHSPAVAAQRNRVCRRVQHARKLFKLGPVHSSLQRHVWGVDQSSAVGRPSERRRDWVLPLQPCAQTRAPSRVGGRSIQRLGSTGSLGGTGRVVDAPPALTTQ